jgi:hypothetical protein
LQITNMGNGHALWFAGDVVASGATHAALVHWGSGYDGIISGPGNVTVGFDDIWTYGFGWNASFHSIRLEGDHPAVCANNTQLACLSDADCPGSSCVTNRRFGSSGAIKSILSPRVSGGSVDFIVDLAFIQGGPKVTADYEGQVEFVFNRCATGFNTGIMRSLINPASSPSPYKHAALVAIRGPCQTNNAFVAANLPELSVRDITVAKLRGIPDRPPLYDLIVGDKVNLIYSGNVAYNACRRRIEGTGTIRYIDAIAKTADIAQRWGGNASGYLGVLDCDQPQTTTLASPTVALSQTTGGTLSNGTYCYRATAVSESGETVAGDAACITLSGCSSDCGVAITVNQVHGASGWKIYGRPPTSGGTFGLLQTLSGWSSNTWTDTGSDTPGAGPPSTDSSAQPNPIDGELWMSKVGTRYIPRYRSSGTTYSMPIGQIGDGGSNGGIVGFFAPDGTKFASIVDLPAFAVTRYEGNRGAISLGVNGTGMLTCSALDSNRCSVSNSPTSASHIVNKSYVDTSKRTLLLSPLAFTAATACTQDVVTPSGNTPGYSYLSCPDAAGSEFSVVFSMPDGWSGSALAVAPVALHRDSASNTLAIDWSCKCISSGSAITAAYGTAAATSQTASSVDTVTQASFTNVTCAGTCSGASTVALRGVVNATSSSWTNDPRILGVEVRYDRSAHSD